MNENNNSFRSVITNRGFLNLWINQVLVQLSYNALNFALIIWVFRLTQSNTAVSALLFCIYIPAVLFGLFAGVLVDVTDRRKIIMSINILLAICFVALIFFKGYYLAILILAFIINTLAQFYSPAESSAIPLIVKEKQLLTANSLFSTTLFASFLLGFGLAGPLIHFYGINFVFGFGAIMLFIAFLLSFKIPPIISQMDAQGQIVLESIKNKQLFKFLSVGTLELRHTIKAIRGKVSLVTALLLLSFIQVAIAVLAVLVPSFFETTLQINATDASYILIIPLGLGMVTGGVLIGKFGASFPKRRIVTSGVILAGLLLFSVGISPLVSPVIKYFPKPRPLPFFYQPPLSTILTVGSFLLGICMVSIVIPSQTVLQENTSEKIRGKVFAVLGVLMSGLTLIPVILTGILADVFGPLPLFIAMGGTVALLGLLALKPDFYFDASHLPYKIREFLGLGHWEKD